MKRWIDPLAIWVREAPQAPRDHITAQPAPAAATAYSPELNPIEILWDEVREKYFHNRLFNYQRITV